MNVHSLSSPLVHSHGILIGLLCHRPSSAVATALWAVSSISHSDRPQPGGYTKLKSQDFVSMTASAACCDMTGAGCSGANSSPNGVGVGCAMNWQIAATTLRMHVAYTAVSILLRPFSSESTRSAVDRLSFVVHNFRTLRSSRFV